MGIKSTLEGMAKELSEIAQHARDTLENKNLSDVIETAKRHIEAAMAHPDADFDSAPQAEQLPFGGDPNVQQGA